MDASVFEEYGRGGWAGQREEFDSILATVGVKGTSGHNNNELVYERRLAKFP